MPNPNPNPNAVAKTVKLLCVAQSCCSILPGLLNLAFHTGRDYSILLRVCITLGRNLGNDGCVGRASGLLGDQRMRVDDVIWPAMSGFPAKTVSSSLRCLIGRCSTLPQAHPTWSHGSRPAL